MKTIFLIKTGSTFPRTKEMLGDFEDWVIQKSGLKSEYFRIIRIYTDVTLPEVDTCSGVIITGSHSMVTDDEPWIYRLSHWTRRVIHSEILCFGLCFGHQLMAHALGGQVGYHPKGKEIGTVSIQVTQNGMEDPLIEAQPHTFRGHVTHSQTVLRLPESSVILAGNMFEPHHAVRFGDRAWGVQFHPEFNTAIMRSYVEEQQEQPEREGLDVPAVLSSIHETPEAESIIANFVDIVKDMTS